MFLAIQSLSMLFLLKSDRKVEKFSFDHATFQEFIDFRLEHSLIKNVSKESFLWHTQIQTIEYGLNVSYG